MNVEKWKMRARVRQCSECGKIFQSIWNYSLCEDCRNKASDKESQIRDFIRSNHNATILDIAGQFKVSSAFIFRMINEGRLSTKQPPTSDRCRSCGVPIRTGMYCPRCQAQKRQQIAISRERAFDESQQIQKIETPKPETIPEVAKIQPTKSRTSSIIRQLAEISRNNHGGGGGILEINRRIYLHVNHNFILKQKILLEDQSILGEYFLFPNFFTRQIHIQHLRSLLKIQRSKFHDPFRLLPIYFRD